MYSDVVDAGEHCQIGVAAGVDEGLADDAMTSGQFELLARTLGVIRPD